MTEAMTLKRPVPELAGAARTGSAPSQAAAVVGRAAEESSSSLSRGAAIQKTFAPYVVAAVVVILILGAGAWALFGGGSDLPPGPEPLPKTVKPPVVVTQPEAEQKLAVEEKKTGQDAVADEKQAPEQKAVAEDKTNAAVDKAAPAVEEKAPVKKERVVRTVASAEAKATLSINSSPAMNVLLDGTQLGRTPLQTQVAAGDHQLTFKDDKLGLKHSRQIRVERGDVRREEWRAGKGRVSFRVVPYAEVYEGPQWLGLTPLAPVELYEGEHVFKFVNKDTGRDETRIVRVEPDKEIVVKVDLRSGG
jgi:hypothetical protein